MTSIPTTANRPRTTDAPVPRPLDERLQALDLYELRAIRGEEVCADHDFDNSFDNGFDNIGY